LKKGEPIYLPVKSYEYYENIRGNRKNFIQINKNKLGGWEYGLIKEIESSNTNNIKEIGIDIGLVNLIMVSSGNQYGKKLFELLKKYTEIIDKKRANRQRQGFEEDSRKIKKLEMKIRNLIKNEVGRILNRMIEKEKPKVVVVENLNIHKSKTKSRKVNRYLKRYGFGYVVKKLTEKCQERGINLKEVNSAYTSQECSKCGFFSKLNRVSQKLFICRYCGLKINADYNAALNILKRFQDEELRNIGIYTSYCKVREILGMRFLSKVKPYYSSANPLLVHIFEQYGAT
jgi:putative transposase